MKSKFNKLQTLLAAIIILISANSTRGQTLHHDWTFPGTGTITNLPTMAVIENGDRYVAEKTDDGFSVAKYNDDGRLMWRTSYVPEFEGTYEPMGIAYNAGIVFVLTNANFA